MQSTDAESTKSQQYSFFYAEPMIEFTEKDIKESDDIKANAEKDLSKGNIDTGLNNNNELFAAAYRKNIFEYKTFNNRKSSNLKSDNSENINTIDLKDSTEIAHNVKGNTLSLPTTIENALERNVNEATNITVEKVAQVIPNVKVVESLCVFL